MAEVVSAPPSVPCNCAQVTFSTSSLKLLMSPISTSAVWAGLSPSPDELIDASSQAEGSQYPTVWCANRHGFSNSCTSCSHSPVIALLNQRCALISGSPE